VHIDQFNEAWALAPLLTHVQSAVDKTPAMVLQYVPANGTGGAAATCQVETTTMTFLVDGATPAGADVIGTSGIIDTSNASYNTLGELCDYIDGRQAFRAYLVGALRADKCSMLLAAAANSCMGDTGLTLYFDTSDNFASITGGAGTGEQVSTAISGERFVNNGINGHQKDADSHCENALLYADIEATFTGTGAVTIFSGLQGSDETLLVNDVLTSTTAKTYGATNPVDIFIKSKRKERLVVRASTTTAFTSIQSFIVQGKTAVLSGDHFMDTLNYTVA